MLDRTAVVGLAGSIAAGLALGDLAIAILGPWRAARAPRRWRRAAWLAATAACRRVLPWSTAAAIATGVLAVRVHAAASVAPIAAGAGAVGVHLLLVAGRIEVRGRCATGRALARLAGPIAFLGAAAFAVADAASHVVATGLVGLGGWAALLAGLSGKPRSAGALALALCATGLASLLVF